MNATPPTPPRVHDGERDEELMARLGRTLAEADPPPPDLLVLGRAAYSLRRLDEELAELVGDSLETGAAVRAADPGERLLSFSAEDMSIDLQVLRGSDGVVTLLGEVDPPVGGVITIEQVGSSARDVALVDGRFDARLDGVGPVRVRIVPDSGPSVSVSWFSI